MTDEKKKDHGPSKLDEVRQRGGLAKPDVYPPEEFVGLDGTGEFPEWREAEEGEQRNSKDDRS